MVGGTVAKVTERDRERQQWFILGLISVESFGEGARRPKLLGVLGVWFRVSLATWN